MSWASPNVSKAPQFGAEFTEAQRAELTRAATQAVFLRHPRSSTTWALRVNEDGALEFLATQTDRAFDVVGTLTAAGVWSTAGAQNPAVGAATPGR